jgi:hypothetical protein
MMIVVAQNLDGEVHRVHANGIEQDLKAYLYPHDPTEH